MYLLSFISWLVTEQEIQKGQAVHLFLWINIKNSWKVPTNKCSIQSSYLNCHKNPHLFLDHLCINPLCTRPFSKYFWLCAFALGIHVSNRTLMDGRCGCVLSARAHVLCKSSIWKVQAGHCRLLSQRPQPQGEAQGSREQSYLFLHALYLFSRNSKGMVSFHTGINGMQKVSLPLTASLPSLCHLCISCPALCVFLHCAISRLFITEGRESNPRPKATPKE